MKNSSLLESISHSQSTQRLTWKGRGINKQLTGIKWEENQDCWTHPIRAPSHLLNSALSYCHSNGGLKINKSLEKNQWICEFSENSQLLNRKDNPEVMPHLLKTISPCCLHSDQQHHICHDAFWFSGGFFSLLFLPFPSCNRDFPSWPLGLGICCFPARQPWDRHNPVPAALRSLEQLLSNSWHAECPDSKTTESCESFFWEKGLPTWTDEDVFHGQHGCNGKQEILTVQGSSFYDSTGQVGREGKLHQEFSQSCHVASPYPRKKKIADSMKWYLNVNRVRSTSLWTVSAQTGAEDMEKCH